MLRRYFTPTETLLTPSERAYPRASRLLRGGSAFHQNTTDTNAATTKRVAEDICGSSRGKASQTGMQQNSSVGPCREQTDGERRQRRSAEVGMRGVVVPVGFTSALDLVSLRRERVGLYPITGRGRGIVPNGLAAPWLRLEVSCI